MNNSPPDRFWPFNIQAARPTAPEETPPEFRWKSRMAFPASCHGSLHSGHQMFLLKVFAVLCILPWLTPAFSRHPEGYFAASLPAAISITIGTFLCMYAWAERTIVRQIFATVFAVLTGSLIFQFSSFVVLQVVGAIGAFLLIDRFLIHSLGIRSTAPHPELVQDQFIRLARSRFWPFPTRRMNLWTFWTPLFGYMWAAYHFKTYSPESNVIDSMRLQFQILCVLIAWPVACSAFTFPFTKSQRKNVSILQEFVRAARSFLFYNQVNAIHPFVFQSPAGSAASRQLLVTAAILLTAPVTVHDIFSPEHLSASASEVTHVESSVPMQSMQLSTQSSGREVVTRLVIAAIICALNAILIMATPVALCFACCGSLLVRLTREGYPTPLESVFTTANWQKLVDHMRTVDGGIFKHHLLMGVNAYDGSPVIIPREALREHMHILGETGSGKTSMGLAPIVQQLVSFGDCSVAVLDLKGDDQTLPAIQRTAACHNSGLPLNTTTDSATWKFPYRNFHPSPNFPSHSFNPLRQKTYCSMTDNYRSETLAQSMGLVYGNDYAKKFFTDENLKRLLEIIRANPDARSFEELLYFLQLSPKNSNSRSDSHGSNVDSSVARLAEIPSLNQLPVNGPDPFAHAKIDLINLFERPQALLFTLPAATGNSTHEDIARIALYLLIEAAQCAKQPRHQVYVVIDEFQRIVSPKIGYLMQTARNFDVSLIFANQSLGDLKAACGGEAYSAITGNTRIRQYFSLRDPAEVSDLMKSSGECMIYNMSYTTARRATADGIRDVETVTYSQQISTKLRPNDIIEASDHPNRSVFQMFRGIGVAQYQGYPFILHCVHHISKAEHQRRSLMKWPAPTPSTSIIVPRPFQLERQNASKQVSSAHVLPTGTAPTLHGQSTTKVSPPPPSTKTSTASPLSHLVPQAPPSQNIVPPAPTVNNPHIPPLQQQKSSIPKRKPSSNESTPKPTNSQAEPAQPTYLPIQKQKVPQPQPPLQKPRERPTLPSPLIPGVGRSLTPSPLQPTTTPPVTSKPSGVSVGRSDSKSRPTTLQIPAQPPADPPLPDPYLNPALLKLRQKLNDLRNSEKKH